MNKAVFLDRDGTINVEYGYIHKPEQFELLPGTVEGMKLFQNMGYLLIVVTNQSGIGRGYYSEEDYMVLEKYVDEILAKDGVKVTSFYHCPHIAEDNCECRKPKLGMYLKAASDYDIDIDSSVVIGDRMRDLKLCDETKAKGFLIASDTFDDSSPSGDVCVVNSILEAAQIIKKIHE